MKLSGDDQSTIQIYLDAFEASFVGISRSDVSQMGDIHVSQKDPGVDFKGVWVTSSIRDVSCRSLKTWCASKLHQKRAIIVHGLQSRLLSGGHHVAIWNDNHVIHYPSYREMAVHVCSVLVSNSEQVDA